MENPATTNQPREPFAIFPIPGTKTRMSRTMLKANPVKASLRITCTFILSAM